jgi:hypothetical protein
MTASRTRLSTPRHSRTRPPADDPVAVVYSRRIKPGREADLETGPTASWPRAWQFAGQFARRTWTLPAGGMWGRR